MTNRHLFGVVLAGLLSAGVLLADGLVPDENYFDSRWGEVEKAFQAAKESRDFSKVKEELRKFFTSPSQDIKALGLRWIGHHRAQLTTEEVDDFSGLFVEMNPGNSLSEGVRVEMANRHLAEASAEERRTVYMTAVRAGSVKLERVEQMPRFVALGHAAADGLEEFRPFIEQYREEIDAAYPADPCSRSEKLLWMLKLRAGAKDRTDAVRLHARRLAEMEDQHLADLMNANRAFRAAAEAVLAQGCEKRLSEPCLDLARVAMRQEKLKQTRPIPEAQLEAGTRPTSPEANNWLDGLREMTAAARVKIARERIETEGRLPQR